MNNIEKIVFVELNPVLPNAGSQFLLPRHGALAVGSKLKEAGYDVKFLYEPFFGEINSDIIRGYQPDIVAFTAITATISKVEKIARELKKDSLPIIIGGEHASMYSDSIDFADYIVVNEGEVPVLELLSSLNNGNQLTNVPNLRYKLNGGFVMNPIIQPQKMPIDFKYDLDIVEGLDSLSPLKRMRLRLPLQTSRGCPYQCNFCVTENLLGRKYRRRDTIDVLADIESGLKVGVKRFMIVDNHFGIGYEETESLLEAIISEEYGASFTALVRTDITKNPKIIGLMKKAGISNVSVGIESLNDKSLKEWNKEQKIEDVELALKVFHECGISVLGLFMAGADHDAADNVRRIPEFALKNRIDKIQISPWTITPFEKEHQYRLIPEIPFDYYNGHFVTMFPLQIKPSVLQEEIAKAYEKFYSALNTIKAFSHSGRRLRSFAGRLALLYAERMVVNSSVRDRDYVELLRQKENGLYNGNQLVEFKLRYNLLAKSTK